VADNWIPPQRIDERIVCYRNLPISIAIQAHIPVNHLFHLKISSIHHSNAGPIFDVTLTKVLKRETGRGKRYELEFNSIVGVILIISTHFYQF